MSFFRFFLVTISLVAINSCAVKEEIDSLTSGAGANVVFDACIVDESSAFTKTEVQSDGKSVWWNAHEAINIFYGDSESSRFTSTNDAPAARAQFTGSLAAFTGEIETGITGSFWAVYPYNADNTCDGTSITAILPDSQTAKSETFADGQWMTIARAQGLALSFYAVCAGFRFSVVKEGVTSVTFRGNNNEVLAGKAKIGMDASGRPVVLSNITAEKEITLSAPNGESLEVGKMYYMTFFPNNFTQGFTITFNTESESATREYNNAINFNRTDVHRGKDFDKNSIYSRSGNITFSDNVVESICIQQWDEDGDGKLSYFEAANVTELGTVFKANKDIVSFDELQYFTGLTEISSQAFQACSNLASLTLPETLSSIGQAAFANCSSIGSICIPARVSEIATYAFYGCSALTSIVAQPQNPPTNGNKVFDGSKCKIYVPDNSLASYTAMWSSYSSRIVAHSTMNIVFADSLMKQFCVNKYDSNKDKELSYAEAAAVKTFYTTSSGLSKSEMASIVSFDEFQYFTSVQKMDSEAFKDWTSLTSITLPESLTSISYGAFRNCSNLTKIIIPRNVTTIEERAFNSCTSLTRVDFPKGLTHINERAFASCKKIQSIYLPEGVEYIGKRAFYYNESIKSDIIIPSTVTYIGDYAFAGLKRKQKYVIPEGVTYLGKGVFYGNALTSIEIKCEMARIADSLFCRSGLTSIQLPKELKVIGMAAFSNTKITSLDIPEGVTSIAQNAFRGTSISSIVIPSGIKTINEGVFSSSKLSSIELPNTIKTIAADAFSYCHIESINLPEGLLTIGDGAFSGSYLTNIVVPESVTNIGSDVFKDCTKLLNVTIGACYNSMSADAIFSGCSKLDTIIFTNSLTSLGSFKGFTYVKHIIIPSSISTIPSSTFEGCSNLLSIQFPETLKTIKYSAFKNCKKLSEISFPDSLNSIEYSAFESCISLVNITLPQKLSSIGVRAFSDCSLLNSITSLNPTPPSLGNAVFDGSNCPIYVPEDSYLEYSIEWGSYESRIVTF